MLEHDLSLTYAGSDSVKSFHEVCRSVLNPGSLSFVAANTPWELVHLFAAQQALIGIMIYTRIAHPLARCWSVL
jgi:hypothetical protein